MKLKTIIFIYFCLFVLSLSILFIKKKENFCKVENNLDVSIKKTNKKWAVLLTTAIDLHDHLERKKIYEKQIDRWIKETDLDIFVIESTNKGFNDIPKNQRLKIITLDIPKNQSSSQSECQSIIQSLKQIPKEYNYIFKVTGRYFLKDLHKYLKDIPDADIYLQKLHCNDENKWQNTEYFGIKRSLLEKMLKKIEKIGLMENNIYDFVKNHNLKFYKMEPFLNDIRRGGDSQLLNPL